mgnify:FL=1
MNFLEQIYRKYSIQIIFFLFLLLGLFTYKDYGVSIDEKFQRLNGFFWLEYLFNFTDFQNFKYLVSEKISLISNDDTLPSIHQYNFYGIFFDVPASFLEILFDIQDVNEVYNLRHLLNFIYFFLGSIFFYRILINRFDRLSSLLGTLFFILSPRIYGESFYNSKDIVFLSFLCVAIFYCFEFYKKGKIINILLFSLFSAICIQTRSIGIFLPLIFGLFYFFSILSNKKEIALLKIYFLYLILTFLFLYIFWPYLWESPITNFFNIFINLSLHTPDIKILFNGNYIDVKYMPFDFLPTWIFISTPFVNFFLFIIALILLFIRFFKRLVTFENLNNNFDLWRSINEKKDLFIFFSFLIIFALLISFNISLVNSWRYVFFLNIFIIYLATFTIYIFFNFLKKKSFLFSVKVFLVLSIIFNFYKLIQYHPFQGLYFNSLISKNYKNKFEVDYASISGKHAINWILNNNNHNKNVNLAVSSWSPLNRSLETFDKIQKNSINIIGQNYNEADYIFTNNISEVDKLIHRKYDIPKKFYKTYTFQIDDVIIYEIFKK